MKKNLIKLLGLALVLCLALCLTACGGTDKNDASPAASGQSQSGGDPVQGGDENPSEVFHTMIEKGGTCKITKYVGTASVVVIPEQIDGLTVTKIDQFAFQDMENLTKVVLPDTVRVVCSYAFCGNDNLEQIDFGKGLKEIGMGAVMSCPKIERIEFPEGLEWMDCPLQMLEGIREVYVPASLKDVGKSGISSLTFCPNLTVVTPKDSFAAIIAAENGLPIRTPEGEEITFDVIPVLERAFSIRDLGDGTCEISKVETRSTVIEVPETIQGLTVVEIGKHAFSPATGNLPNAERITLPDTSTPSMRKPFSIATISRRSIWAVGSR